MRKVILEFFEESAKVFGFTILCMAFFTVAFGEEAKAFSASSRDSNDLYFAPLYYRITPPFLYGCFD